MSEHAPDPVPDSVVLIPRGLVILIGPPASGKTAFVRALVEGGRIDPEAVVSSDEIRRELAAPDAELFAERDRRIAALLAAGRSAVAESTNVTPAARTRLIAIAERFDAPVTALRFTSDLADLLEQHTERDRIDLSEDDIRAYAAIMARDADADRLRAEGAGAVHTVPGRSQGISAAEAAARFAFA